VVCAGCGRADRRLVVSHHEVVDGAVKIRQGSQEGHNALAERVAPFQQPDRLSKMASMATSS
jgi:hypothetical protein